MYKRTAMIHVKDIWKDSQKKAMDPIQRLFNQWAENGRDVAMQKEHGKTVHVFLKKTDFEKPFTFLDIGCGNGWVVRAMAGLPSCQKAAGIDKSKNMIRNARQKKASSKESYEVRDIEKWNTQKRFDRIFSMETIYYTSSPKETVRRIFDLLKPGGVFFCGTDFYADNKATSNWEKMCKVKMHLMSRRQWKKMFDDAGFSTRTTQIKDKTDRKKWKREMGTLFIIGTRPAG